MAHWDSDMILLCKLLKHLFFWNHAAAIFERAAEKCYVCVPKHFLKLNPNLLHEPELERKTEKAGEVCITF